MKQRRDAWGRAHAGVCALPLLILSATFVLLTLGTTIHCIRSLLAPKQPNRCFEFIDHQRYLEMPVKHATAHGPAAAFRLFRAFNDGKAGERDMVVLPNSLELLHDMPLGGRPVLFVPGHKGSFNQSKPIVSQTIFHAMHDTRGVDSGSIDFFTIDFAELSSALDATVLAAQASYVNDCIATIQSAYVTRSEMAPPSVVLLGHSMGGIVARGALVTPNHARGSVRTILTFSSPHQAPPVSLDRGVAQFYAQLHQFWHNSWHWCDIPVPGLQSNVIAPLRDVAVLSIGGGQQDLMIRTELGSMHGLAPADHTFFATASSMVNSWQGTDHATILWCGELVRGVAMLLVDLRQSQSVDARIALFRKYFGSGMTMTTTQPQLKAARTSTEVEHLPSPRMWRWDQNHATSQLPLGKGFGVWCFSLPLYAQGNAPHLVLLSSLPVGAVHAFSSVDDCNTRTSKGYRFDPLYSVERSRLPHTMRRTHLHYSSDPSNGYQRRPVAPLRSQLEGVEGYLGRSTLELQRIDLAKSQNNFATMSSIAIYVSKEYLHAPFVLRQDDFVLVQLVTPQGKVVGLSEHTDRSKPRSALRERVPLIDSTSPGHSTIDTDTTVAQILPRGGATTIVSPSRAYAQGSEGALLALELLKALTSPWLPRTVALEVVPGSCRDLGLDRSNAQRTMPLFAPLIQADLWQKSKGQRSDSADASRCATGEGNSHQEEQLIQFQRTFTPSSALAAPLFRAKLGRVFGFNAMGENSSVTLILDPRCTYTATISLDITEAGVQLLRRHGALLIPASVSLLLFLLAFQQLVPSFAVHAFALDLPAVLFLMSVPLSAISIFSTYGVAVSRGAVEPSVRDRNPGIIALFVLSAALLSVVLLALQCCHQWLLPTVFSVLEHTCGPLYRKSVWRLRVMQRQKRSLSDDDAYHGGLLRSDSMRELCPNPRSSHDLVALSNNPHMSLSARTFRWSFKLLTYFGLLLVLPFWSALGAYCYYAFSVHQQWRAIANERSLQLPARNGSAAAGFLAQHLVLLVLTGIFVAHQYTRAVVSLEMAAMGQVQPLFGIQIGGLISLPLLLHAETTTQYPSNQSRAGAALYACGAVYVAAFCHEHNLYHVCEMISVILGLALALLPRRNRSRALRRRPSLLQLDRLLLGTPSKWV